MKSFGKVLLGCMSALGIFAAGMLLTGCAPKEQGTLSAKGKPPGEIMKNLEEPAPTSGEAPKKGYAPAGKSIKSRIQ